MNRKTRLNKASPRIASAPKSLRDDELRTVAGGYIQHANTAQEWAFWLTDGYVNIH
ncbi:MAG TPA: hypothetical protein VLV17_09680 [Anaeromyxobacteraceae bacterium]|nr:hypothetical protein [Anaeromyxobacteraceae bacterium]